MNTIYPVGIVAWFAQNKNPNTLFPGTKWNYVGENKTVRLASQNGNNILSSGGSDNIKLTSAQLPAHNHSFSGTTNSTGAHTHTRGSMNITATWNSGAENSDIKSTGAVSKGGQDYFWGPSSGWTDIHPYGLNFDASKSWTGATSSSGAHNHTISGNTSSTGSGSAINITNSYIMLMAWYRVS
ncbi:phage tail protein [Salmonella enterica subsp. enterica serovar Enteritidis]|nr:phage tail protein [Salmonella enterica subsp. enterica serovar Enteritidis]